MSPLLKPIPLGLRGTQSPPARGMGVGGTGTITDVCADAESLCDELARRGQMCAETGALGLRLWARFCFCICMCMCTGVHTALRKIQGLCCS